MGCCSRSAVVLGGVARSAGIRASALHLRLLCPKDRGGGGGSCCCCSDESLRTSTCIMPGAPCACLLHTMALPASARRLSCCPAWHIVKPGEPSATGLGRLGGPFPPRCRTHA